MIEKFEYKKATVEDINELVNMKVTAVEKLLVMKMLYLI